MLGWICAKNRTHRKRSAPKTGRMDIFSIHASRLLPDKMCHTLQAIAVCKPDERSRVISKRPRWKPGVTQYAPMGTPAARAGRLMSSVEIFFALPGPVSARTSTDVAFAAIIYKKLRETDVVDKVRVDHMYSVLSHSLLAPHSSDVVVDRARVRRLGVLPHDGRFEALGINVHLGDRCGRDVREVEVARLGAEAGPARRALFGNWDLGRQVLRTQIKHRKAGCGVCRDERACARDRGQREWESTSTGRNEWLECGRKRAVRGDIPDGEEAGGRGRHALDGDD